jgi:hypothetical protein
MSRKCVYSCVLLKPVASASLACLSARLYTQIEAKPIGLVDICEILYFEFFSKFCLFRSFLVKVDKVKTLYMKT